MIQVMLLMPETERGASLRLKLGIYYVFAILFGFWEKL